jgi:hypothetical protein
VNFIVKLALLGVTVFCVDLSAQMTNQSMMGVLPLLKTNITAEDGIQGLLMNGFVSKGPNGMKQKLLEGMIDSIPVVLTLQKTSKNGKIWGYELLFKNADLDWQKKRIYIDQLAQTLNVINGQNSSVLLKTLPQYCHGNESQCFIDGFAKYQYLWYWNSSVARIRTMDLRITPSFQLAISITDNAMEVNKR